MSIATGPVIPTLGLQLKLEASSLYSRLGPNLLSGTNVLSNYAANQSVTITQNGNFIQGVSNQNTSTPGVWPICGTIACTANTRYTFRVKGYVSNGSTAWLYVAGNVNGNLVWQGNPLTTTNGWVENTFTPSTDTTLRVGILWSSPTTGSSIQIEDIGLHQTNTFYDMSQYRNIFSASNYTFPTMTVTSPVAGSLNYFTFVNNGSTVNNIYSTTQVSTSTQTQYTRIGWFQLTGNNGAWSPIIQNSIGNNSDMGLAVSGNRLHFRQYTNTGTSGTTSGDYGVSGSTVINLNTWYQGAIVVDRTTNNVKLYVNGVLDSSISINVLGNSSSDTIVIGGASVDSYGGDRMFKGYIASVSHYNRLLSASEIAADWSANRSRYGI
jgi:hypothetical protein